MFILSRALIGGPFMDASWQKNIIGTLLGFTAYHLSTRQVFSDGVSGVPRAVFDDWNKFGTMLVVSRMIVGGGLFDLGWIHSVIAVLVGFTVYQLFVYPRIKGEDYTYSSRLQMVIDDCLKFGTMLLLSRLLTCGSLFNTGWLVETFLGTLLGFSFYDIVFSKLVENTKISVVTNS